MSAGILTRDNNASMDWSMIKLGEKESEREKTARKNLLLICECIFYINFCVETRKTSAFESILRD